MHELPRTIPEVRMLLAPDERPQPSSSSYRKGRSQSFIPAIYRTSYGDISPLVKGNIRSNMQTK
jgi:hypothetical protein